MWRYAAILAAATGLAGCRAGTTPVDDPVAIPDTIATKCWQDHTCFETQELSSGYRVILTLDLKKTNGLHTIVVRTEQTGMSGSFEPVKRIVADGPARVPIFDLTALEVDGGFTWRWRFTQHPGTEPADHDDTWLYRLPYSDGARFEMIQGYGGTSSHQGAGHYSVDFAMPEGTPVLAARGGQVVATRANSDRRGKGWANFVIVRHDDGTYAWYMHLKPAGVAVTVGQAVSAGDLLGLSGDTGYSAEPHLHFQVSAPVQDGPDAYRTFPTRFRTARGDVDNLRDGDWYEAVSLSN